MCSVIKTFVNVENVTPAYSTDVAQSVEIFDVKFSNRALHHYIVSRIQILRAIKVEKKILRHLCLFIWNPDEL